MDASLINEIYLIIENSLNEIGPFWALIIKLLSFSLIISIYAIFVYYSSKYFSKRDIFEFNFRKYIYSSNPKLTSFFGFIVYLLEYIVLLPFLVIIWFCFYSIFLMLMAKDISIENILLISTALIGSIRICAFFSEKVSEKIAGLLPFTLLAVVIIGENFFSITGTISKVSEIPTMINTIPIYLLFIAATEFFFRFFYSLFIFSLGKNQ